MGQKDKSEKLIYNKNFKKEGASMCSVAQNLKAKGRQIGLLEGITKGREEGRQKEIFTSVHEGDYSAQRGADKLGLSLEDFITMMESKVYNVPTND